MLHDEGTIREDTHEVDERRMSAWRQGRDKKKALLDLQAGDGSDSIFYFAY